MGLVFSCSWNRTEIKHFHTKFWEGSGNFLIHLCSVSCVHNTSQYGILVLVHGLGHSHVTAIQLLFSYWWLITRKCYVKFAGWKHSKDFGHVSLKSTIKGKGKAMPHEQNQIQNSSPEPDTFHSVTCLTVIHHSGTDLNWSKKTEHLYFFNMVETPKSPWLKAVLKIQFAFLRTDLLLFA